MRRLIFLVAAFVNVSNFTRAADSDRDFSGKWILHAPASRPGGLPSAEPFLNVEQNGQTIRCASEIEGMPAKWSFDLSGADTKYRIGSETRNSAVKWEGAALLINTLVSGPRNYVLMDRWRLSPDRTSVVVTRHVIRDQRELEGVLVYRLPEQPRTEQPDVSRSPGEPANGPARQPGPTPLRTREEETRPRVEEPGAGVFMVRAGARILLSMLNTVDTKHSREGDRVYLETAVPVFVDGRLVIPRGSAVTAVVSSAKQPGRAAGKGELYLRFDSLTLPNGVTRDFRSRLVSADASGKGDVDRKEGKITSPGDRAGDARTVGTGTAVGAAGGGIAGAIGGNARLGTGIGAAAGAAAGLGRVLTKRGPDASLPRGTRVEMLLDRDLQFSASELQF
jgi:type IV secretion system protein VirB10